MNNYSDSDDYYEGVQDVYTDVKGACMKLMTNMTTRYIPYIDSCYGNKLTYLISTLSLPRSFHIMYVVDWNQL